MLMITMLLRRSKRVKDWCYVFKKKNCVVENGVKRELDNGTRL